MFRATSSRYQTPAQTNIIYIAFSDSASHLGSSRWPEPLAAPADYLRRHTWQPSDDAQPYGQLDPPAHALIFDPHLVGGPVTLNVRPRSPTPNDHASCRHRFLCPTSGAVSTSASGRILLHRVELGRFGFGARRVMRGVGALHSLRCSAGGSAGPVLLDIGANSRQPSPLCSRGGGRVPVRRIGVLRVRASWL